MKNAVAFLVFVSASGLVWAGPGEIGLPPLARVVDRDPGTGRWQVTGSLPGALPVARRDFGLSLHRQGWSMATKTVMGGPGAAMSLTVWVKGERRLLLMLWENEPGKTRFSLGEEDGKKRKRKGK